MKIDKFYPRLLAVAGFMGLATWVTEATMYVGVPPYTYFSLFFLTVLMGFLHHWVYGRPVSGGNAMVRRLMVASMLRMLAAAAFVGITLYSFDPISFPYVVSYCAYFAGFLVFEISQMRYKLRPDFKPRPE